MKRTLIRLLRIAAIFALLVMAFQPSVTAAAQGSVPPGSPSKPGDGPGFQQPSQQNAEDNVVRTLLGPIPFKSGGLGEGYHYVRSYGVAGQPYPSAGQQAYLNQPAALAMDSSGHLFATERNGNRLWGFDTAATPGTPLSWAPYGIAGKNGWLDDPATVMNNSQAMLVDPNGYLWVANWSYISIFNKSTGAVVSNIQNLDRNNLPFWQDSLDCVTGLAMDTSTQPWKLFVAEQCDKNLVLEITVDSPYSASPTATLKAIIQDTRFGNWNPNRILLANIGSTGNRLYVAFDDEGNGGVDAFQETAPGTWEMVDSYTSNGFRARALAYNANSGLNLLLSAFTNNGPGLYACTVNPLNCSLLVSGWDDVNKVERFNGVEDLVFNPAGTALYLADANKMVITKFTNATTYVTFYGVPYQPYQTPSTPTPQGEYYFNNPAGVSVDAAYNVYILEQNGNRLTKFNASGQMQWSFGVPGSSGWQGDTTRLNWPEGSPAVDKNGLVYIPDRNNNRVVILNGSNGSYLGLMGNQPDDRNRFDCPTGVATAANGDIFVLDSCRNAVLVYDQYRFYRSTVGTLGEQGSDNAHFSNPRTMALIDANTLLVADANNARIQKCTRPPQSAPTRLENGAMSYAESWSCSLFAGVPGESNNNSEYYINSVSSLAWDSTNQRLLVGEENDSYVKVLDAKGQPLAVIGEPNNRADMPGYLRRPYGLAVDAQGRVYVADQGKSTVDKFMPTIAAVETAGMLGGPVNSIATDGTYLYTDLGSRLAVFSRANPQVPVLTGYSDPANGAINKLAVDGGYAYITTGNDLLRVMSLADKTHPVQVGQLPVISPQGLGVGGNYAFTVSCCAGGWAWNGPRLEAIDISNKASPKRVATYTLDPLKQPMDTYVDDIKVFQTTGGQYDLYLLARMAGVIKITFDPTTTPPSFSDPLVFSDGNMFHSIAINANGQTLYAIDNANGGDGGHIHTIQTQDMTNLNVYDIDSGWGELYLFGNHLYHTDRQLLTIFDTLNMPNQLLGYNAGSNGQDLIFNRLVQAGGYLYSTGSEMGLMTSQVNLQESTVTMYSRIKTPGGGSHSLAYQNGIFYSQNGWPGISRIDSSDPSRLVELSQDGPGGSETLAEVVDGHTYLFTNAGHFSGQNFLTITDDVDPWKFYATSDSTPYGFFNNQSRIFLRQGAAHHVMVYVAGPQLVQKQGGGTLDLLVFDVDFTDPAAVTIAYRGGVYAGLDHLGLGMAFYTVSGHDYLLVPDTEEAFVFDISNPDAPTKVGTLPAMANDLKVLDGKAYVTGDNTGLMVFDLTNIATPETCQVLGSFWFSGWPGRLALQTLGGHTFASISTWNEGTLILDVTDPAHIQKQSRIQVPNTWASWSVLDKSFAYVAYDNLSTVSYWLSHWSEGTLKTAGDTLDSSAFDGVTYKLNAAQPVTLLHMPVYDHNIPALPAGVMGAGHAFMTYARNPDTDQALGAPAAGALSLTVHYNDSDIYRVFEGTLALYYWDGAQWVKESTSQVNTAENLLTASPTHDGLWAVAGLGISDHVYLPGARR